jgi:50S ribosomal protein L16 3-hydroxylase
VALEPGMTYSIGFRAPSAQEMATEFLVYLQDRICVQGRYADPDLQQQAAPAQISDAMVEQVSQMLQQISWDKKVVADFLGHYLTEPKPHVFYEGAEDELDEETFAGLAKEHGIVLDLKSQILYVNDMLYCNGQLLESEPAQLAAWQRLANTRQLESARLSDSMMPLLFEGYLSGWWHIAA